MRPTPSARVTASTMLRAVVPSAEVVVVVLLLVLLPPVTRSGRVTRSGCWRQTSTTRVGDETAQ
jgi:hypothetical protein